MNGTENHEHNSEARREECMPTSDSHAEARQSSQCHRRGAQKTQLTAGPRTITINLERRSLRASAQHRRRRSQSHKRRNFFSSRSIITTAVFFFAFLFSSLFPSCHA